MELTLNLYAEEAIDIWNIDIKIQKFFQMK